MLSFKRSFQRPFVFALALGLFACGSPQSEESEEVRLIRQNMPGITSGCLDRIKDGSSMPPVDQCFQMGAPKRWRGLWADYFEGQQFCSAPATDCDWAEKGQTVWLSFAKGARPKGKSPTETIYQIEFIGRRTWLPGMHGHMGMFTHEIVVDQIISIHPVAPALN
jgi:hypothetical protein